MRAEPTDAERRLWWILRDRRLAGLKFRRQHPIAGYIADFYAIGAKLVVELDGGQHDSPDAREYDQQRTTALEALGIRVLRFWSHDVLKHPREVAEMIYKSAAVGQPSPRPSPGVPGEGESRSHPGE